MDRTFSVVQSGRLFWNNWNKTLDRIMKWGSPVYGEPAGRLSAELPLTEA